MNAKRFFRRLGFFLLTLVLVDLAGRDWLEGKLAITDRLRLPENQEMGFLPSFIDRLDQRAGKKIVFLGSSPTWGVAIREPRHTYPETFAAALRHDLPARAVSVDNFAAKGLLAADLNAILRASIDKADGFVIQLNYHTFSPHLLNQTPIRHPDLPESLGVAVPADEARWLNMRPTPLLNWNASLRAGLRRIWWFYREREKLALLGLGANPESWIYHRFYPEKPGEDEAPGKAFYELKPAHQMVMVQRYAQNADFILDADNVELRFVGKMLEQLQAKHKPAVFFLAPINAEALRFYEVMNWKQYRRNVDLLRQRIEAAGYRLIDINTTKPLPEDTFADISHTLDAGGEAFGPRLWALSRSSLEAGLGP